MSGNDELMRLVRENRGDVDERALFWIDTVVATAEGSSAENVDWTTIDWDQVREDLERWLRQQDPDTLDPTTPEAVFDARVPGRDDVRLLFRARPRSPLARGNKREPSLVIGDRERIPDLHFDDGSTASLYDLPIERVRDLAVGHRTLAIELPSHRQTWDLLLGWMEHAGLSNTSEMDPLLLEPTASALGYIEAPDDLGDFDETWRLLHGFEFPMVDDPRDEEEQDPPGNE